LVVELVLGPFQFTPRKNKFIRRFTKVLAELGKNLLQVNLAESSYLGKVHKACFSSSMGGNES
jgi:hypothetical protein